MQTLVEKIPEDILRRTTFRKKKVTFKEEAKFLGPNQESGEWSKPEGDSEEENLFVESGMMTQRRVVTTKTVFA